MARDRPRAEDALQEALTALARDGTDAPATVGIRAWLARAAISRARHALRSDARRARRERVVAREEGAVDRGSSDAGSRVREALSRVDGEDEAVLTLRYLHGMGYAEIAAVLDVAEPTARVRVHRALDRVRAEAREPGLPDSAMGVAIALLPRLTVEGPVLAGAISTAISGASVAAGGAAASAVIARAAGPSAARWLATGLVAAVAAVGAFVAWDRLAADESNDAERKASIVSREADGPPRLEGRPAPAPESPAPAPQGTDGPRRTSAPVPSKGPLPAPSPSSAVPSPPPVAETVVTVRLELVSPDAAPEDIAISEVYHRGNAWPGGAAGAGVRIPVRPNTMVTLRTADPRAAAAGVHLRIPDPVPSVLVGHLPAANDPRLASLTIEVVDAKTGAPVPEATLLSEDDAGPALGADGAGRIVLPSGGGGADLSLAERWFRGAWSVSAPGYQAEGGRFPLWDMSRKELAPFVFPEADLRDWLDRGALRVALRPLDEGWRDLEIRLLDAQGRPASGMFVVPSLAFPSALGATVTPRDACPSGPRRTRNDGRFSFAVLEGTHVVGLDVARGGIPIAAYLLHLDGWPETGPRDVRLPALADVEVSLESAPPDAEIAYMADWLGAARTPVDGPAFPLTADPDALRFVRERRLSFMTGVAEVHGVLPAGKRTFRFPMPVGTAKAFHLAASGTEGARLLTVEATTSAPLRIARRWDDLPPYDATRQRGPDENK